MDERVSHPSPSSRHLSIALGATPISRNECSTHLLTCPSPPTSDPHTRLIRVALPPPASAKYFKNVKISACAAMKMVRVALTFTARRPAPREEKDCHRPYTHPPPRARVHCRRRWWCLLHRVHFEPRGDFRPSPLSPRTPLCLLCAHCSLTFHAPSPPPLSPPSPRRS